MIEIRKVGAEKLSLYDTVPMNVLIRSIYTLERPTDGSLGLLFREVPVQEQVKDMGADSLMAALPGRFDLANWAFFLACDGEQPVGGAVVASRTDGVWMLDRRQDMSVLWDLRVADSHKGKGVGRMLFERAAAWSREQGLIQMKIECQNNNVTACRFYRRQGAVLGGVNPFAYVLEGPEFRDEIQLLWYLDL